MILYDMVRSNSVLVAHGSYEVREVHRNPFAYIVHSTCYQKDYTIKYASVHGSCRREIK